MYKIMFVCLGNICRSPMAELLMKDLVKRKGRENDFFIASAGTSGEEEGNPVYYANVPIYNRLGIDYSEKRAVRLKKEDYDKYDFFIGMDNANVYKMKKIFGGDEKNKISLLMDYTKNKGEVSDPWWTRDFEKAFRDITAGVSGLYDFITNND